MGSDEKTFTIFKFRTMTDDAEQRKHEIAHLNQHRGADERMFKAVGDPRVTRVGAFLRRTSIDELPQLFNVLRGEMSLVGPRPLILEEDSHVLDWARERLRIKPGITGLWQVLGRSDIPFGEMVQLGLPLRHLVVARRRRETHREDDSPRAAFSIDDVAPQMIEITRSSETIRRARRQPRRLARSWR